MNQASTDIFGDYDPNGYFCEMFGAPGAEPLPATELIRSRLGRMRATTLKRRARATDRELFNLGITFTVYSERDAIDRARDGRQYRFPFPR